MLSFDLCIIDMSLGLILLVDDRAGVVAGVCWFRLVMLFQVSGLHVSCSRRR